MARFLFGAGLGCFVCSVVWACVLSSIGQPSVNRISAKDVPKRMPEPCSCTGGPCECPVGCGCNAR